MEGDKILHLTDTGITGHGMTDDSPLFQSAIDRAAAEGKTLYISQGIYVISETLRVPSHSTIVAHPNAKIVLDGGRKKCRGDYLLTNADHENGNEDIRITGGIWDGNNQGEGNQKPDIFDPEGYSGVVLNFFNIRDLHLSDMVVANSVTYYVRMARLSDFTIENISFVSDRKGHNQDGLHFNGEVHRGRIKNIRALSYGQTNDDLIALNADDAMNRVENYGMVRGEISELVFEGLFAENCHTIIRLLSTEFPIRNVTVRNVYGGFRTYAINADGARYCRTPLFSEADRPLGCGCLDNMVIEHMVCRAMEETPHPAVCLETRAERFEIRDFTFIGNGKSQALVARNLVGARLEADGRVYELDRKTERVALANFEHLTVTNQKER